MSTMTSTLKTDLSEYHQTISDLFPKLPAKEAFEKYRLSQDQVESFHEQGYIAGIKILEHPYQIDQLLRELDELKDPSHPKNRLFYEFHTNESKDPNAVLFHSLGHWRITPGFHDVLWNPAFVIPASQLFGNRAVRFWHDQLFCKPANHGGVVAWHQDYSYWTRTKPIQHLTCWVGLDDVNRDNGCLCYVPGSHRWGLLDKPELAGDMEGLDQYLTAEQKKQFEKKVLIEMKKGYGTFHHPLMVHGSYRNNSPNPRRAFVINVFADGTTSDSDDELLQGVPRVEKGKKIDGKFFPLLFDPQTV
jgi:ectoine hydroxylase-related dioxygenase (phytanoyl-CoA dioxygenase family)